MACQQWPLPEPHKGWLLKSDLRKKALIESGLIKPWQSGPKLDKKPEPSKKWLLGPGPLEPLPLGMKCKPWFKDRDRLPSRYLSRQNNKLGKCPTSMDSRRWVFVKEGLDDFRTGCPSPEDVITRGPREGFLPMISQRIPPPEAVHPESPWKLNLEPPEEVNLEPEDQAHVETAKESLQSYLFSLFPEEETNAACTTDIPKVPGLQKARRRVREFFRWINDNFGDIGLDEEDIMKQFEIDLEVPLTHNTVKIKKISQLPLNIKPCKQLDDIQQRKFSLQEGNWERKLRKQQDPYKPKREKIRYGAWYLDPKCWKKLVNEQPLPDPKVVPDKEHQTYGRHLEPDIIDELYGPIAFKDFIVSKGYRMPGVIEKMFMRKGWTYESVKTPIHRVMKLLSKPKEEDSGDKED
ncbi:Protein FAM47A [Myotis brandtii]|uniref:Protein FAM47A n=1 Tax=Myotis brandtii TaxID=109478 RepID=S7PCW7_MYOBR|nr:PREDICTED: protein FAM47A [Myotis brandtii]EPQ05742.1 Protein FAM47A [Myotis brandtii]